MVVHEGPLMNLPEKVDEFLVGQIAFPATNYFLNRKGILGQYRKFLRTERLPQEALRDFQFVRLSAAIRHAYEHCPFYTKRFKDAGITPDDIRSLEDFRLLPPLDRRDVVKDRLDLVDVRYREAALAADNAPQTPALNLSPARFRGRQLVRNNTSGSSGTPTIFYEDGSTSAMNWVHEQRLKSWYGIAPGAKEARMKLNTKQYRTPGIRASLREHLWNQIMLPGYFLSDAEHAFALQRIRKFRPRVLWGPTPALTGLAAYIQRSNQEIGPCRPRLVISWAAPLYEHEKKLLGEVFRCPVSNIYGTREVGHVAMMCPQGSLHINQESHLVEIESDGEDSGAGRGRILVTPLFPSPMPFLRYRLGDLVDLSGSTERTCPCGRSLTVIKEIMGRTGDVFYTEDGHALLPNFWCHIAAGNRTNRDIEKYQIVYRRPDLIRIRIVPRLSYSLETEAELRSFLEKHFSRNMHFEFEYVTEILPQASGKTPFVVNEVHPAERPERAEQQPIRA